MSTETEIVEAMGLELAAAAMRAGEPTTAAAVLAATQYRLAEVDPEHQPASERYRSMAAGWLAAYRLAAETTPGLEDAHVEWRTPAPRTLDSYPDWMLRPTVSPTEIILDQIQARMSVDAKTMPFHTAEGESLEPFVRQVEINEADFKRQYLLDNGVLPTTVWVGVDTPQAPVVEAATPQPGTVRHLPDLQPYVDQQVADEMWAARLPEPYPVEVEEPKPFTEIDDDDPTEPERWW